MRALRSGASTASTDGVRRGTRLKKGTPPYSPSAEYRRVRGVHAGRNRPQSTRWYSSERVRRVPYGTPHGLQTEYRRAVTHGVLPRYSAVLPMRRRAREYDEYRTVLRGSGTRGGLRGSDPKRAFSSTTSTVRYSAATGDCTISSTTSTVRYSARGTKKRVQAPFHEYSATRSNAHTRSSTAATRRRPHVYLPCPWTGVPQIYF